MGVASRSFVPAEERQRRLEKEAKPYVRPLTYEARLWPGAGSGWPLRTWPKHWEVWVRDANGRLAASARGRWKWLALQRAKHDIDIHEGRARSKYRFETGELS